MYSAARWIALTASLCLVASLASAGPILWGRTRTAPVNAHPACINGAFCDASQDTAALFTGGSNPQMIIDDTIFFGILTDQTRARSAAASSGIEIEFNLDFGSTSEIPVVYQQLPASGSAPEPELAVLIASTASLLALRRRPA